MFSPFSSGLLSSSEVESAATPPDTHPTLWKSGHRDTTLPSQFRPHVRAALLSSHGLTQSRSGD